MTAASYLVPGTSLGPDAAYSMVKDVQDKYEDRTDQYLLKLTQVFDQIAGFNLQPYTLSVNYAVEDWLPDFVRPTRPALPAFRTVDVTTPEAPEIEAVEARDIGDAPVEPDLSFVTYAPPPPPNVALPVHPTNTTPVLDAIIVPDRPDMPIPEVPELLEIVIPEMPVINLPAFTGVRPDFDDIDLPPDGALDYTEVPYASALLDLLKSRLMQMAQDGIALSPAAEQAIYNRGRTREERTSQASLREIDATLAARGMGGDGIHARAIQDTIYNNRSKLGELNRDIVIKQAELAVDGVKFAIGQGITLENVLIQQNLAINERALKLAMYARDYALNRVNTIIAIANLQRDLYLADAQVWKTTIDGELAKLEVLKAEIDAQRLVGEVNKNLVDLYESQTRAVTNLIQAYNADVEAAKTRGEINNQRIEVVKGILEGYATDVDAYAKAWDGYKAQVEAGQGSMQYAETLANVFNIRMNGYKTKGEAYATEAQTKIASKAQTIDVFRAQLAGVDQDLRAQLGELDAQVRAFAAQTALYQADGSIVEAESAAMDRAANLRIAQNKNLADVKIAEGQINSGYLLRNAEMLLTMLGKIGDVYSQLVASAQSGVHYGASFSGSLGQSVDFNRSLSWSGDVDDHTGIGF